MNPFTAFMSHDNRHTGTFGAVVGVLGIAVLVFSVLVFSEGFFGSAVNRAEAVDAVEPTAPNCPLAASASMTVVDFGNGGKTQAQAGYLMSNNAAHKEVTKSVSLPVGTYTVKTVSWDGYNIRTTMNQPHEQWNMEVRSGGTLLGTAGPTTDIADMVREDMKQDTFTDAIVLSGAANTVAAVHAYPNDTSSPNSVVPICIGFIKKEVTPAPTCTLSANPTSVTSGSAATLTLASTNATSATINQSIGTVATNGTKSVSPTQTTTYTATVTGAGGTATCQTTVTVTQTPAPTCALTINPNTILSGNTATLSWTSANTTGGTIDNGVGSVASNASKTISPTQTTTYTGTFTGTNGSQVTCSQTITVTPLEPTVPACPFTPSADLTVVDFNGGKTRANAQVIVSSMDVSQNTIGPKSISLVPGVYTVQTYSWDGYNGRATVSQLHEQWNTLVKSTAGALLGTAGPTTDVPDLVTTGAISNTFTDAFTLTDMGASVSVTHAFPNDTSSPNSVVPVCVAFQKKIMNPAKIHGCVYEDVNRSQSKDTGDSAIPNTTITLTGTTYTGGSVTRTMQTGTDGCYLFDNLEPGTYRVAETQPTGYDDYYDQIGTKGGNASVNDIFSNIVLASGDFSQNNNFGEVKTPVTPPTPVCTLSANPILINQGGFSTLTLTSTNATSATINQSIGTVAVNGVTTVSPTQTTTYMATVTGQGGTATCQTTVTVTQPSTLACSMNISDNSVKLGSTVTLTWSSQNATSATIDPTIGNTTTSGARDITVFGDTTYVGTFTGANGQTTTCRATVTVERGGGSCTGNCGGGGGGSDPKPNIVLSSRTLEPLDNFVYLSSVPYTGFEAGPLMTALFWMLVFALSTGVAYALTFLAPFATLDRMFTTAHRAVTGRTVIREHNTIKAGIADIAPHLFPTRYTPAYAASTISTATEPALMVADAPVMGAGTASTTLVEESAHAHNMLLSPEAERLIKVELTNATDREEAVLEELFTRAANRFPKEDGWILLSKERINELLAEGKKQVPAREVTAPTQAIRSAFQSGAIHARELADAVSRVAVGDSGRTFEARIAAEAAPAKTLAEELKPFAAYRAERKETTPASFVELIVAGKQQETFEALRGIAAAGKTETFLLEVVRALDEAYKQRIEGGRAPEKAIVMATASWSNRDFEEVISTLIGSADYSYSSPLVGAKVAVAKLFEKLAK